MINKKYEDILKAAEAGGEVAKKYFGKILQIEGKTMPCDFRTKADLESEKAILEVLDKKFPNYNIFSEETGETNKNSEYTFVIDPLDGTNNFVLGVPYFSTSIALMKGNEIIFGAIYNPVVKNMYYAQKGKGAYLNGVKIQISKESDLKNSSISLVVNYGFSVENYMKMMGGLSRTNVKRVLTLWSVALDYCLLASGKIEALVLHKVPLYDFAAGKIIAREAGARITDFDGKKELSDKNDIFLTTNGTKIHGELLKILNF
jgi:myo-inositol-1(or 4)-monophosphatase